MLGQDVVNDYRRFTGEAVRLAMTEFVELAGDKVKTIGFSWKVIFLYAFLFCFLDPIAQTAVEDGLS